MSAYKVNTVKNNAKRINRYGKWSDAKNEMNGETIYNPQSVTIQLDGHVKPSLLNKLSAISNKSILGSGLLALCESVCKEQGTTPKLQIEADNEYKLVMKMDDDKTYQPYRHSGYTDKRTGEYVEQTYIEFEIPRQANVGVSITDF